MAQQKQKVFVIGSGFGGLATACRLAARGHDVEIFERRDKLGGRAYVYEINGFKFDGGPTIITAPYMFDEIWELAGKKREDYIEFVENDPYYRIFNHEGRKFDYNGDTDFILGQIDQWNPADKEGYLRFVDSIKPIFEKGFKQLADQPFLTIGDMMRVAPDLIKLQSYVNVYPYVSKFIDNEFLRRCFSFHPLLIGGNPFDSSSIYSMIHYLEREWGVWFAMGGTGALVKAMARLFDELGGKVHLNADVKEITVSADGQRVTGLRLADGSTHQADIIVSNADVMRTYTTMIPEEHRPRNRDRRYNRYKYSMSLFVWYFGTNRRYSDTGLAHHNIILGERYRGLLSDIFHKKIVADDFSLYLHMPTITDPSLAPEGHENFYVLSPVPHLGSGTDWSEAAEPYKEALCQFLEENYLPNLSDHIVASHTIDPLHFRNTLNSHLGSAFSVEPTLLQSAWFRPHNRSEDFANLYFVGAGTHPGAGLPGVLSSAVIADNLIQQDTQVAQFATA
ncbi:MAG: phytoene desaturase [Chloroflexi bacterium]|nr:phytoene desaturase [Chloroflexota bacterium]